MKNKAFTLIELLAVLVVLAILALISIPITIRIINQSRENSYKRSIESYAKAFEKVIAMKSMENSEEDYGLLKDYVSDVENNYSGNRVECDFSSTSNSDDNYSTLINGKLILRGCHIGNSHNYQYINGEIVEEGIVDYSIGTKITVAGEEYFVIADSYNTQDYVTALKAEPLTVAEVNLYGGVGTEDNHVNRFTKTSQGTAKNYNGYGEMAYYSTETNPKCGENEFFTSYGGCITSYDDSDVKYVIESWRLDKFQNNELKVVNNYQARLIEKEEVRKIGWPNCSAEADWCSSEDRDARYVEWLGSFNRSGPYWTMSRFGDHTLWIVYSFLTIDNSYDFQCVRPVINVYKDKIED